MNNKMHHILDDAWEMKEELMGGAAQTLRIGLITNTVMNSIPAIIPDISELMPDDEKFKVDFSNIESLNVPVLLHFEINELQLAILIVRDKDSNHIQCYPFNDLNEDKRWWAYEMAFDLTPDGRVEIRPIHPLLEEVDFNPDEQMMNHLEVLALVVSAFVHRLQKEEITLVEETVDFSKINKKRAKSKKAPIVNNWIVKYVKSED